MEREKMSKYKPQTFIKKIKSGDHALILQEDDVKARDLRLEFIQDGLENNEHCIYVTAQHDAALFEGKLQERGVDVAKFKESGHLIIVTIQDPFVQKEGFTTYMSNVWNKLSFDEKQKTRFACNVIRDIARVEDSQVKEFIKVEKWLQDEFMNNNFAILCSCDIANVSGKTTHTFLQNIHNHNSVIFAPKGNPGCGFYLK